VVCWAGLKLTLEGWDHGTEAWLHRPELALHLPQELFLGVTLAILVLGSLWALRHQSGTE